VPDDSDRERYEAAARRFDNHYLAAALAGRAIVDAYNEEHGL
jgi:hypothetical protein